MQNGITNIWMQGWKKLAANISLLTKLENFTHRASNDKREKVWWSQFRSLWHLSFGVGVKNIDQALSHCKTSRSQILTAVAVVARRRTPTLPKLRQQESFKAGDHFFMCMFHEQISMWPFLCRPILKPLWIFSFGLA